MPSYDELAAAMRTEEMLAVMSDYTSKALGFPLPNDIVQNFVEMAMDKLFRITRGRSTDERFTPEYVAMLTVERIREETFSAFTIINCNKKRRAAEANAPIPNTISIVQFPALVKEVF